jgi:hypothetical protein
MIASHQGVNFWGADLTSGEGITLTSFGVQVESEPSPKLVSRRVVKLAESSKVEAKEFLKDDVVKKPSSLATVVSRVWYLLTKFEGV